MGRPRNISSVIVPWWIRPQASKKQRQSMPCHEEHSDAYATIPHLEHFLSHQFRALTKQVVKSELLTISFHTFSPFLMMIIFTLPDPGSIATRHLRVRSEWINVVSGPSSSSFFLPFQPAGTHNGTAEDVERRSKGAEQTSCIGEGTRCTCTPDAPHRRELQGGTSPREGDKKKR